MHDKITVQLSGRDAQTIDVIGIDGKPLATLVILSQENNWHNIDVLPACDRPSRGIVFGWHNSLRHEPPAEFLSASTYCTEFPRPGEERAPAHDPDNACESCSEFEQDPYK